MSFLKTNLKKNAFFLFTLICAQVSSAGMVKDTTIAGVAFQNNFFYESAILTDNYKKAFWKEFQNSKSEFDDKSITEQLSPLLKKEKERILATRYLMSYNFALDPYDFEKKQFQAKHYSFFWSTDSLVCFSSGNEWFYKKKYARLLTAKVERSNFAIEKVLTQYIKIADPDSAKKIAEVSRYAVSDARFYKYPVYLLEFSFSPVTVSIYGNKKPLLMPSRVIMVDADLKEVLSIPFSK